MKNIIFAVAFMLLMCTVYAQTDFYCYTNGTKRSLSVNTDYIYLSSYTIKTEEEMSRLLDDKFTIVKSHTEYPSLNLINDDPMDTSDHSLFWVEARLRDTLSLEQYLGLKKRLGNIASIDYVAPVFSDGKSRVNISENFYVRLKSPQDTDIIRSIAQQTHTTILGRMPYQPLWYILQCSKHSRGDAVAMSDYFQESGQFSLCQPVFFGQWHSSSSTCPTDPSFADQWYLNNTGQQLSGSDGYDIHACDAWSITTGSPDIKIGLVDNGPDLTHPDLSANLLPGYTFSHYYGCDAHPVSSVWSTGDYVGPTLTVRVRQDEHHGTNVAGILVAQQNNSIGISGVAPGCKLMPFSVDFGSSDFATCAANAIGSAYVNGMSVINCSWGWGDPGNATEYSGIAGDGTFNNPVLTNAISTALVAGRGGLGCVVVAAAGENYWDPEAGTYMQGISYPWASGNVTPVTGYNLDDVIVVGATSICQERHRTWVDGVNHRTSCADGQDNWNSLYGDQLDIMAPGVNITTTDNMTSSSPSGGQYRNDFFGTSAAAPQVAGVAALILSLYPCLTEEEVGAIIQQSAQKIGSSAITYTYANTSGHPYGTWHHEMGYGMLNAYESLNRIIDLNFLQFEVVNTPERKYSLTYIRAGSNVNPRKSFGPYRIDNGGNVDIKATQFITFEPGFEVTPGGVMLAHIESYTGDCTNWTPTMSKNGSNPDIVSTNVGHKSKDLNSNISILPNPFKTSFEVKYNILYNEAPISIAVYDLTGRLIYSYNGMDDIGSHSLEVPVSSSASLYIVKACIGDDCQTQKMIKYESN